MSRGALNYLPLSIESTLIEVTPATDIEFR